MELILLTANECDPCHQAEEAFRKKYKEELDSGEAEVVNLDEDEGAQAFWAKHKIPWAPVILVTTDAGKLVSVIDPLAVETPISPSEVGGPTGATSGPVEGASQG